MIKQQRLYKTIYNVTKVINSSLEPSKVLDGIAEQVTSAMEAKGCFIRVMDRLGEQLTPGAYYGLSDRYAHKGPVHIKKSAIDQEALKGKIVTIEDVTKDSRFQYPAEAKEEGLISMVVVPLTARGEEVIGVLRVYTDTAREFDTEDLEFLACVANLSGIALENARMFNALKRANELANAFNYRTFED